MSYGTTINCEIYASRMSINEIPERVEWLKIYIESLRSKLKMFAIATPRDIMPLDDDVKDPITYVHFELEEILNELVESVGELYKLELMVEAGLDKAIEG